MAQAVQLTNADLASIQDGLNYFKAQNLSLNMITPKTFPLAEPLKGKLTTARKRLFDDTCGYFLLRGIDAFLSSSQDLIAIHMAISAHVGEKRGMAGGAGGDKSVLQHITDMRPPTQALDCYHAPPNQTISIPFHSDLGDLVSLFCRSRSSEGGVTLLASAKDVYNEIKRSKPDLATALQRNWSFLSGSISNPVCQRPLFFPNTADGSVIANMPTVRILGTAERPRPRSLPKLSVVELKALAAVQAVAYEKSVRVELMPGDLLVFNNLTMLHARESFVDNASIGRKRHLLRLLLKSFDGEGSCKLPSQLRQTWSQVFDHDARDEVVSVQTELFSLAISH